MSTQEPVKDMQADDSNLVDEILNELNDNDESVENPIQQNHQNQDDMRQVNDNHVNHQPELIMPTALNVEYNSAEHQSVSLMKRLKKPIIVLCLTFILFNPLILGVLRNNLPRVFTPTGNVLMGQVQVLILSLVVSTLYYGINALV